MHFKISAFPSLFALFAVSSIASPLEVRKTLDVWSPKITSPTAGTVWVTGSTVNVTWDTSDAPKQISNGAAVMLRDDSGPVPPENPYLKESRSFDLRDGWVTVEVPNVPPADNYVLVLFGDSGNWSEQFEITEDATST
ncbi:hypothetical protein E1B28_009256 [Marasmius oreades]|uniref:Yeast cell wall synthesis Kre9/Knh1-like N-terminal domain-containing protein n=1 Tax=Marasmius oreades TaxID=181124 RepID=A0A9P7S051_9AGAR|nr:uncharacterized protein E1B28_009256 [Marasmius oreades]KAG7092954.1 hypothetical protein E1B28_009256 [Marasmius oreades]